MSEIISFPVNNIPEPDRRSLENLLGHPLAVDQQVCVMVFSPSKLADDASRRAAVESIRRTLDKVDRHRLSLGITDNEFDAALDEAMNDVRPQGN